MSVYRQALTDSTAENTRSRALLETCECTSVPSLDRAKRERTPCTPQLVHQTLLLLVLDGTRLYMRLHLPLHRPQLQQQQLALCQTNLLRKQARMPRKSAQRTSICRSQRTSVPWVLAHALPRKSLCHQRTRYQSVHQYDEEPTAGLRTQQSSTPMKPERSTRSLGV